MLLSPRSLRLAALLFASSFAVASVAEAGEVRIFRRPGSFFACTGARALAFPDSAATAYPDLPFGTDLEDYSCTDAAAGVDLPFGSLVPTANVASPEADWMCFIGPDWNAGPANIDPQPIAPVLVANGEDDFEISFDPPVHAVGAVLLTNAQADEIVTLHFEDGSSRSFGDTALRTEPNAAQFVGFQSKRAIVGLDIDTAGGAVQNEALASLRTAAFYRVRIDVRPGSDVNPVNCKSRGKVPVAILSSRHFDAAREVDVESLRFGATGEEDSLAFCNPTRRTRHAPADLLCHFETQAADFCSVPNLRHATLTGRTLEGTPIRGWDAIRIVPDRGPHDDDDDDDDEDDDDRGRGRRGRDD